MALALFWICACHAFGQEDPRPPCEVAPEPAYAEVGGDPRVGIWKGAALATWTPPACIGWPATKDGVVIALAGRFRHDGSSTDLLRRFGAVSALRGIRYWSVSDKRWRVLIADATAIGDKVAKQRRENYSPSEFKPGEDLYFVQADSRSTGEVIYRLRVREANNDRIVIATENTSPVRALLITLFDPGELKSVYFLERRGGGVWNFYALSTAAGRYADGNDASLINRAAAFYRHFSGVATDGRPPLAP